MFTDHTAHGIVLGIALFEGFFQWYFNISRILQGFQLAACPTLDRPREIRFDPLTIRRTDLRSYLEPAFKALLSVKPKWIGEACLASRPPPPAAIPPQDICHIDKLVARQYHRRTANRWQDNPQVSL